LRKRSIRKRAIEKAAKAKQGRHFEQGQSKIEIEESVPELTTAPSLET